MARKALRQITKLALITALIIGAIIGAYFSAAKSLQSPTEEEINNLTNVGASLSAGETIAVQRSRQSAVQVMSLDLSDGGISTSSGTYVKYKGKYFILTTSHGVGEVCALTQIIADDVLYDCAAYVLRDPQTDYIIIQIGKIPGRSPVELPAHSPHRREWTRDISTQTTTFYTGFPNEGGPYTFDGKIVGYKEGEAIFVDSYGWSGSSGSGVFADNGNLIGYVMALEVGETYFGRQVLENFMWVIPLFKVDWQAASAFAD
tara:strand:- start:674 stop:1453 length:780 start_codon:yes stop_codon:yes gene_type:complete